MPKADRILANLPPTFRATGDPSALRALVDAYGGELQTAENLLVAVMRAHWVDFADAGERTITDLASIGALYGLAPRADESVEEFRDHLKRYVRTFLEGTVTVRGLLRITAESLGLHIEDDALDTWWDRADERLVTSVPDGADAASLVFGFASVERSGADAQPAAIVGDVDLRAGVDLRTASTVWIALDGGGAIPADVASAAADPARVLPDEIVAAVHAELGVDGVASIVDGRLRLASPSTGTQSEIAVDDGPGDAAEKVLGLRPRSYQGAAATPARVTGTVDLSTAVDLTDARYLRISVDGSRLAEIDCAALAADAAAVDIGDIAAAINATLGAAIAADDGRFLTLTSPTPGRAGYIAFLETAAQAATGRLFGAVAPYTFGTDELSATAVGDQDLGPGVDLTTASRLRLALDAQPPVTVDVAGADPATTTPAEIVTAINEGLADTVASHDGSHLTIASSTPGASGSLVVEEVDDDAAPAVLGLRPRSARGTPAATASLTGAVDLSAGVDLSARHTMVLSVDGQPPVTIDLRNGVGDVSSATVDELADAINAALGSPEDPIATDDGAHLILVSPTAGAAGSIVVSPLLETSRRRFVTRARVIDDAPTVVLGFTAGIARGAPAEAARVVGDNDLSAGADLTVNRYLRLRVGDLGPSDVDCAGPRPRATTPYEIVAAINDQLGAPVAFSDGRTISVVSPVAGADSSIVIEPPQVRDAIDLVLGTGRRLVRGSGVTGVRFVGTADLAEGAELPADAAIRLAVDGAPPADIPVGDPAGPTTRSLSAIVAAINQVLVAQVAAHDGTHLLLSSPTTGTGSQLEIGAPGAGTDVTADLLGIDAPRSYHGSGARPAELTGLVDLTGGIDLRTADLLGLAVDGADPIAVDLTAGLTDAEKSAVSASQIATAINSATTAQASTMAIPGGLGLRIVSPTAGLSSRIEVTRTGAGDAAPLLFGRTDITVTGTAPAPAELDGVADLLAPVDLDRRSVVRIGVDGQPPVDVDLAGVTPSATLLGEIVDAINAVRPGLARATPEDRLRLVSPTEGPASSVEVFPLRVLELVEYPTTPDSAAVPATHGALLRLRNSGAADVPGRVALSAEHGVTGPRIADPVAGWTVRVHEAIGAGGSLVLDRDDGPLRVTIVENGTRRTVPPERVELSAPDGSQALLVRRGLNTWGYSECRAARFDAAYFDGDQFAGGPCTEEAVFDLSRFGPRDEDALWPDAVFASSAVREPTAAVTVTWDSHTAGGFEVNLPAELDRRFGIPFGDGRFGTGTPELHGGVVTEPVADDNFLVTRVNDLQSGSKLIEAAPAPTVPIGWSAVVMPFRDPTPLTGGRRDSEARLYLSEPGLAPGFIELRAAEPGEWGNDITVTCRAAGPAIYDLEVAYLGGRFERARDTVFGPSLPTPADALLQPGPVGVGTAKAAGIHAEVTRDRVAEPVPPADQPGASPDEEGTP